MKYTDWYEFHSQTQDIRFRLKLDSRLRLKLDIRIRLKQDTGFRLKQHMTKLKEGGGGTCKLRGLHTCVGKFIVHVILVNVHD